MEVFYSEPCSVTDWTSESDVAEMTKLTALQTERDSVKYISQGYLSQPVAYGSRILLASEGFSKCSGLILQSQATKTWRFGHVQPLDDEIYNRLLSDKTPVSAALIVQGTQSTHQKDLEEILDMRGILPRTIKIETGNLHFGISFLPATRSVSVVRQFHTIQSCNTDLSTSS